MTLIINFLSRTYVVQVSDRRLTSTTRWRATKVEDDDANKAVLWGGRASFAYTGLARVGGRRTDEWLATTLGQANTNNLSEACNFLASRATEAFSRIHLPPSQRHLKAHWFTAVGWTDTFSADLNPIEVIVTNMRLPDGRHSDGPQREFVTLHHIGQQPGFRLSNHGQAIEARRTQAMKRAMIRILEQGGTMVAICRYLCWALRDEAATNRTIGKDVMLCYLPRTAAQYAVKTRRYIAVNGAFGESNTFLHYRSGLWHPEQLGPHFVGKGMVLTHFTMGPL